MRILSRKLVALGGVAVLALTAACASDDNGGGSTGGDDSLDQVTYLTSFGNFGRDAYVWVAHDKGYFEDAGIEVDVQLGQGGESMGLLVSGQADFMASDLTVVMFGADPNEEPPVAAVAAVYQNTITGLMALESSGITGPADLEGKTLGDMQGSINEVLFPTYAELAGLDVDAVDWEWGPPPDLPGYLAQGHVDAIGQFMVGKPLVETVAGETAVLLPYSEYLTELYGMTLVVRTDLADEDPDLVVRFRDALLRGLEYAIEHPEETGEILHKYDEQADPEVAAEEVRLLEPYVRPMTPGQPIGFIDEQRLARSIALLESAGSIPAGLTPEHLVRFDLTLSADS